MISHLELGANGRFGNQMFQLAALVGIANRTGFEFRIPVENTIQGFDLAGRARCEAGPACMELRNAFALPADWFAPRRDFIRAITQRYTQPHFHFDPRALQVPDGTDLWGYFQSEAYFEHATAAVRSAFTFREEVREQARRALEQFASGHPRLAVHVRRGDYLKMPERYSNLGVDYYRNALKTWFPETRCQVVVFSDDPAWCEKAFPEWHTVQTGSSYVDMCVMSQCDHFIIANSSFSWWGAWLSAAPGKVVVAPGQWFGAALQANNTADLLPKSWHRAAP